MKRKRLPFAGLYILIPAAVLLAFSFALLLVRQEHERRMEELEYRSFQILMGLLDHHRDSGRLDPQSWPEVLSFALYDSSGAAVYRFGDAPAAVDYRAVPVRGATIRKKNSIVLLRRAGAVPGHMPGEMPGPRRGMMERKYGYIYAELDVSQFLSEGRLFYLVLYGLLSVFIVILALLAVLARRLSRYREREESLSRLVQLGEAARTLAHEIKNPLGVIRIQCATLRKTLPAERQGNVGVIEEETARLALLADRVREFLQSGEGSAESRDARWYIDRCGERWAGRISAICESADPLPVLIDGDRLLQALDNLVSNALESGGGGEDPPVVRLYSRAGQAVFEVLDRGVGIPPENRSRIFEPFFTTKAKGTGIGLALSKKYAEQAGGSLTWTERPGGGSVFSIALPLAGARRKSESGERSE